MKRRRGLTLGLMSALVLLLAVSFSPLASMQMDEQERECLRRMRLLARDPLAPPELRCCPGSSLPYLFSMDGDSNIVIRCPSGHGLKKLERDRWVTVE